jgi:hypothetical protein
MNDPKQPAGDATQQAVQDPNAPTPQIPADAKPGDAPAPAPARADAENRNPASSIIQRLVGQRDTLRTENKMLSLKFDAIEKKMDMLLANMQGFGNEELKTQLTKINADRDQVVGKIQQDLSDQDLVDQAVEASSRAVDRIQRVLAPVMNGKDLENLADPDVRAMQELHDKIYFSGETDYSDLYVLASDILTKRLAAKQVDPTKIREEGRAEALEGVKKLSSVKVDIPGGPSAQELVNNQSARRRAALDAARAQS